ncbi:uncharacterized protein cd44a [Chaetodon auriga]|uniref:uncharacterized protein cd44a n=1 Tax=Chaetodon auriga TaxID=39042 RepID=UPI004032B362
MAPSQVSGLKMKSLLFAVVLGLLAVVHSTPVNTETQDDFYKEARMEEFLVQDHHRTSVTTQAPKRTSTQQPSTESKESDTVEGSAAGEDDVLSAVFPQAWSKQLTITTLSMHSNDQSSTSQVLRRHTDHSSVSNVAHSSTDYMDSGSDDMDSGSGSGSGGDGKEEEKFAKKYAKSLNTEMRTSTSMAAHIRPSTPQMKVNEDSRLSPEKVIITETVQQQQVEENVQSSLPQNSTGQSPSGWIIIVGFIVGVAVLVMLCVAIATRDKWNGPKQAAQLETTTSSSNQQREQEMETFLLKEKPRENGKAAEYTVIPLDELPEKCSAQ